MESTPVEDWRWIVDINLLGVVWGCRAALPVMRAQRSGLVLNVASSAGFAAAPQMASYNATKSAVIALSETLAAELAGSGVQVSAAMPGFFSTYLLDTMRAPPDAAADGKLHIVWPREYRLAWRLKRLFPAWFVSRIAKLRTAEAEVAPASPP